MLLIIKDQILNIEDLELEMYRKILPVLRINFDECANPNPDLTIANVICDLSIRAKNCVTYALGKEGLNMTCFDFVRKFDETEIKRWRCVGAKIYNEIYEALYNYGYKIRSRKSKPEKV